MEDNEKTNENPEEINQNAESNIVDSNVTDEKRSVTSVTNNTTTDSTAPPSDQCEQQLTTNNETQSPPDMDEKTIEPSSTVENVDQQQIQVPTSSTTESTDQCPPDGHIDEQMNCESSINGTSDSTIPATMAANETGESVAPTNTNESSSNNDDEDNANDMASSSRLVEKIESDCRTETKLNNKLDKSEIINELTTASIANCDSSEILLDDSMSVIHSNGSNNVSDSRVNDNVNETVEKELSSCNVNTIGNGAKNTIDESVDKVTDGTSSTTTTMTTTTTSSSIACAIDSSIPVDSTDAKHSSDNKSHEEPTSSVTECDKIHTESDTTPSVHSNISDKGGGTDNRISNSPAQHQPQIPANKIVLNNSVDSINSSMHKVVPENEGNDSPVVVQEHKSEESSKVEICSSSSSSRTDEKIGCDEKHSSPMENQIAYVGSVIRPTNLIVSHVKENSDQPPDEFKSSNTDRPVRRESLPHIELPKSSPVASNTKSVELKKEKLSNYASPNSSTLDLSQPHSFSSRQNSLYVSNPDFSCPKPSIEDLSSLRMKPPDFSKLTHAYSTNNLKIPNPNFHEMDAPQTKKHQPHHPQPPVNPANFAEISKRLNYISDLQLKTTTAPSLHTKNSYDRSMDSSRNLSNLYVKAPDFSGQKQKSHDIVDEPMAHVIHKNPYPNQTEKPNKIVSQSVATSLLPPPPPSDPSIIYRSYPQISQDVTMSIVPTQTASYPQPQSQQQQNHLHHQQQPLSQKQNLVEPQQSIDQRLKQNYPIDVHKGHPGLYRSPVPTAPHLLYENQMPNVSSHSSKPTSFKHKTEPVINNSVHQRESSRAAVIQSGKLISEPESYRHKVQSNYVHRNEIPPVNYDKAINAAKPIVPSQQGHGQPLDYMHSQQQQQQYFNNSRYPPPEFNDRQPSNKSNYERPGYCEPMPVIYQDHYKQPQPSSMKHNSSTNNTQMSAPSNRPLRSPVMNSKPIDIPSSGHMNPPQYWPSHSPRITQSPISLSSSPLSGRVTQSPAGASPSPQHHVMPSVLQAQSPTYRYASPHQTPSPYNIPTTASSPIQFKETGNPAMYQKPSKSKSSKPSSAKGSASQPGATNYYCLPSEINHYPSHQYSIKVEQSAQYPPHQYSTKTDNNHRDDTRTKPTKNKIFPDYVDLTKPSKNADVPSPHMPNVMGPDGRYEHRYLNERHESQHQNHRTETTSTKHAPESSSSGNRMMMDKHNNVYNSQQKTIMDPYAYRKASEADLNYEIIKKTLNKDISIRRSDADLSCSIFDTPKSNQSKNVPYPTTTNEQYYGRGSTFPSNFNYHQQSTAESNVRRDAKGVGDGNRYNSSTVQPSSKAYEAEQGPSSRGKNYPVERAPNDLKKHDLSVTVSRISAATAQPIERGRVQHSETTIPIPHQPSTSRHQSAAQAVKNHSVQPQPAVPQKPTSTSVKSVLTPVKRESPLDLSVKTVKTKADSTGDDYAMPSSSRDYNAPLSLKVDFSPNFQKHARSIDKSTANHVPHARYENQMANAPYPSVHRPMSQQHPVSQNVPQRSTEKLLPDVRYHPTNSHINMHQSSQSPSTYALSQAPITIPSTQIRSHQMPNDSYDSYKQPAKPLVLSPTVPTVFGRKPEELKNLPINTDLHDYKSPSNPTISSYENDHRSKNQSTKTNYHGKPTDHSLTSHHKLHEVPVKFSDFKTKNVPNPSIPTPVESTKDRPSYPYATSEQRPTYLTQYQEQRPMHIPSQSRLIEQMPPGHYDPYYSRKRLAEPPSHHDQYPKVKQMRRDDPPIPPPPPATTTSTNQHVHYYNNMDKRYPPAPELKAHERYEMPAEKMNYHPKFMGANSQRDLPPLGAELRENTQHPAAAVVREAIPPNYGKQHPYHYPEPIYSQVEGKPSPVQPPIVAYPTEQHQKHLAYQKSKKEAYKQLPSPPNQHNYYPRDGKHHPYESNYNPELPYQSYKLEAKQYYNEPVGYAPNAQYQKMDTAPPPPQQQVYQQSWQPNQPNQQQLQSESSKQSYYPPSDLRSYRDINPISIHPPHPSSDVSTRPNNRLTNSEPSSSRQQSNTLKGADQTVISKLRTNLEMKEIEKQKLLRSQSSTETVDDDNQRSDIASLIAARIRTKGELKGFTPMPAVVPEPSSDTSSVRCDDGNKKESPTVIVPVNDLDTDGDNGSAFDLMDWGSACNDFVEQLQGSGSKKRGGRRRPRGKSTLIETEFETVGEEVPLQNLPGTDYRCDIDESLVTIVKSENKSHQDESPDHSTKKDGDSSSDEDKPLLFLRQKSLNELGKLKATTQDESSTFSESTKQSTKSTKLSKSSEKIVKNKKGQQREKRENEKRISIASSSESDDDVTAKVNKRPKKTVRKPRTRSSVGYKNTSDDETSETGSKNSKRKNDHTKRKKSGNKSSSDSEPLKQRKKNSKIDSDESDDDGEDVVKLITTIKQEVISDYDESDCKMEIMKTPVKKEPGVVSVKIEETMTRSKRKQELERQKANSKILRNEKMVKNVSIVERKSCDPKKVNDKNSPKSKSSKSGYKEDAKQKCNDTETGGESSKNDSVKKKGFRVASVQSISSDSEENEVSPRRRTRSAKSMDQRTPEKTKNNAEKVIEKKWSRNTPQKKTIKEPTTKPQTEQYPPGWENEVYEFKRQLKVPASLITIKRPSWYRKSISLPDLDPHSSDTSETFSEKKQLFLKPISELSDRRPSRRDGSKQNRSANAIITSVLKAVVETPEKRPDDLRSKSIIDLLHQKMINPINKLNKKARLLHSNEPKLLPQSTEIELLPTPGSDDVFKHQSVFDTAVLKSRTRKEYRVQKNQEIIREVFGFDDRPASAPPLHAIDSKVPAITFDQKYKQYLEKMNMDFVDSKPIGKCSITPDVSIVKQEKIDDDILMNDDETQDTEINECERNALDIKEEPLDANERDTPSVSEREEGITPNAFSSIRKRGRGARGGRRKGSSGFDYIRKKKKPLPQSAEGGQQKRRSAAINYLQEKDENDINREIRGWVLNKGVGETVLHKAARLGYIDVIAFCLERLEMNPDQKDNAGYTALHEACSRGHLDIARLLLEYGANHSETAVLGGIRPLHEAVENGYIEVVRLLLSYGADPLLATYSGQTPIMLAENDDPMIAFLKNYLHDIQNTGPNKMPWRCDGAWKRYDPDEFGYDMFDDVPIEETYVKSTTATASVKPEVIPPSEELNVTGTKTPIKQTSKCDSNSNIMPTKSSTRKRATNAVITSPENHRNIKSKYKNLSPCTVVLTNLTDKAKTKTNGATKSSLSTTGNEVLVADVQSSEQPEIIEFSDDDSDADFFEIEESQAPHVPLYHLRDEGAVKWALLSDLCYMLKVKSKDTLLKQICSSMPPSTGSNKELLRELKMGDFLERATCLQLLCAGEKLNIRSSKVILVKYNDSVKNLLGVKTVLMKM